MRCTCDDNCDNPCSVHSEENALQEEAIKLRNWLLNIHRDLDYAEARLDTVNRQLKEKRRND